MRSMSWDVKTKAGRAWGRSGMWIAVVAAGLVALMMVMAGPLTAQALQPGVPGGVVSNTSADAPLVASPTTFGTSYRTLHPMEFQSFWGGATYQNFGSPDFGIFIVSNGPVNNFHSAPFDLPAGSTLTEAELYVIDNDAAEEMGVQLIRWNSNAPFTGTVVGAASTSGASPSVQTLVIPISPQNGDPTRFRYTLNPVWGDGSTTGSSLRLVGARIGYIGPVGMLLLPSSDRFVDTRPATTIGGKITPFVGISGSFDFFDFPVTGVPGRDGNIIPLGSTVVVGNVTAIGPTANGLFKILPGGTPCTTGTSTLNFNAKFNTANAFNSGLNASGELRACFGSTSGATSDLTIDVVGATQ